VAVLVHWRFDGIRLRKSNATEKICESRIAVQVLEDGIDGQERRRESHGSNLTRATCGERHLLSEEAPLGAR
jgi:hypothetical protein